MAKFIKILKTILLVNIWLAVVFFTILEIFKIDNFNTFDSNLVYLTFLFKLSLFFIGCSWLIAEFIKEFFLKK